MLFFPEFNLCILPLAVLYVRQAQSQLIPIMKQTSMINSSIFSLVVRKILEIPAFSACRHTKQAKNGNLLAASTRLAHGNYLRNNFGAHGKAP